MNIVSSFKEKFGLYLELNLNLKLNNILGIISGDFP